MPKYYVQIERMTEYAVEAESASEAVDIVLDGDESLYKEVGGETKSHAVFDENGEEIDENFEYDEDEEE